MNLIQKFTAATLSLTVLSGTAVINTNAEGDHTNTTKNTATTMQEVLDNWDERLAYLKTEVFPETVDGKQCYWNNDDNINGYTFEPCDHATDGAARCNSMVVTPYDKDYNTIHLKQSGMYGSEESIPRWQCHAFAYKLLCEVWSVDEVVSYDIKNGMIQYSTGEKEYIPQVGEHVEMPGHSIFITEIKEDGQVIAAQVNANNTCEIDWDATDFRGEPLTVSLIQEKALKCERPIVAGDLNLDGQITSADAAIFESTIVTDGNTINDSYNDSYDVDDNNYVDFNDLNLLRHMPMADIVKLPLVASKNVTVYSRWIPRGSKNSILFTDGSYYDILDDGTATFIGLMDTEMTEYTVPSIVFDKATNKSYTVTEIGLHTDREPSTKFLANIKELTIPDTVTTINRYAFWNGTAEGSAIETINIPEGSQLSAIGPYAFADTNLQDFDFDMAESLDMANVGDNAFKNVPNSVKILEDIDSITATAGTEIKLFVSASGHDLEYKWYTRYSETDEFTYGGSKGPAYIFRISDGASGIQLYCEITDKYGNTVNSSIATVTTMNPGQTTEPAESVDPVKPVETTTTEMTATTETATESTTTETTESTTETTFSPADLKAGDADCSGEVDISDAILVSRIAAEDTAVSLSALGVINADCDGKNGVSASDAIQILKYIAKLVE